MISRRVTAATSFIAAATFPPDCRPFSVAIGRGGQPGGPRGPAPPIVCRAKTGAGGASAKFCDSRKIRARGGNLSLKVLFSSGVYLPTSNLLKKWSNHPWQPTLDPSRSPISRISHNIACGSRRHDAPPEPPGRPSAAEKKIWRDTTSRVRSSWFFSRRQFWKSSVRRSPSNSRSPPPLRKARLGASGGLNLFVCTSASSS